MRLKNKNLSKVNDLAIRNSQSKSCLRDAKDAKLQTQQVNCSNDFQMVAADLRAPINRNIVHERDSREDIKDAIKKSNNHYKNDTLELIVNSKPKFNIVLKAA